MPLGVNFRATSGYVTDPTGFVAQTDFTLYTPSRGYGYVVAPTGGVRDRNNTLDPQIAGIHYGSNAYSFRVDLPNGAGRYRVRSAHADDSADNPTGFRFFDGQQGSEIAFIDETAYQYNYRTILGNHPANTSFTSGGDFVDHVFTSDHLFIQRDLNLQTGNAILSSIWFESVASVSYEGLGGEVLWICPSITNSKSDISPANYTATFNGGMGIVNDTSKGGSKCFEFDGTDDYISTNLQGEVDYFHRRGVWSVAAWVKFDNGASTASHGIVGTSQGSSDYGFNLWMSNTSEGLRGDVAKGGSYIVYPSEGAAWPDTGWHHVAFVSDGTTAKLYRDGSQVATQSLAALATAVQQDTDQPVLFGAYSSGGSVAGVMDGRMDDIRIFRRPLGESEIARLAQKRGVLGPVNPAGLGDEDIWLLPSSTGNNSNVANKNFFPTKYNGAVSVVSSSGAGGSKAFDFGGGTEQLYFDQQLVMEHGKPFSVSLWANNPSNQTEIYFSKNLNTSPYTGLIAYQLSTGSLTFDLISTSGSTVRCRVETATGVVSGNWQHLVFSWDGTDANGMEIYTDGVKQSLTVLNNNLGTTAFTCSAPFTVGGRNLSSSSVFTGQMDDIRFYSKVLDAAEVSHLSQGRGTSGKPKKASDVLHDSVAYVPLQEQGTTFYCKQTNIAGTLSDTSTSGRHVAGPTRLLSNAVQFSSSAQRRVAFASVPSGLAGMAKYTIAAWVKAQVSSTAQRTVVGWDNNTTATSYSLRSHNSATAKGPDLYHAGSAIIQRNTQDNANAWQHVVVQVDTTTGETKSYLNGQLDATATGGSYSAVNSALNSFGIGATFNGGAANYHDGAIAGVAIWDRILTAQEINSVYSEHGESLLGLKSEKLWVLPSRTGDRSNVLYPARANTELSGSLSVVDDVDERGTKAIQFNNQSNQNNYLSWDDNDDSDPVTVAFWIKQNNFVYNNTALIGKSGSGALRVILDPQGYSGSTLRFSSDTNAYTGQGYFNPFGSLEWHHVALVRDYQNNTKFYIDGSLAHTGNADDTTAGDWDAAEYFIGIDKSTNSYSNNLYADIDDLRVLDGAATSGEIAHLAQYRGVLGGPYVDAGTGEFSFSGNDAGLRIPVRMSASAASFTLTGQVAHGNWTPLGLGTEIMWVCPTYTGNTSNLAPSQNATSTGGTLSVIDDSSEQGIRAISCTVTNNHSNYFAFNLGASRDPCTLAFWVKRDTSGGAIQTICAQQGSSSVLQVQLRSSTSSASNTDQFYFWNDGAGSTTGTAINGTWHHIVMERDFGGTNKFYLDGVAHGTSTGNGPSSNAFGGTMRFIASPNHSNGSLNFTGLLDDIRIIPGTLTSSEITHLASRRGVIGAPSSGVSMSAAAGSFTLSGQAAALIEGKELDASAGSFALSGQAAAIGEGVTASVVSFSVTGASAELSVGVAIDAATGSFVVSGVAASDLGVTLVLQAGSFAMTGVDAALSTSQSQSMSANAGSFAVAGQACVLKIKAVTQSASFSVTAQDAFLGLTFELAVGNFQLSGTSLPPLTGTQRPTPYYYRFLMQDE